MLRVEINSSSKTIEAYDSDIKRYLSYIRHSEGIKAVEKTINKAADFTNLNKDNFFVSSTGIIGIQLDVNKITNNFDRLFSNLHVKNFKDFAQY